MPCPLLTSGNVFPLQGDTMSHFVSERLGLGHNLDLSDTMVQQKLDEIKDQIKREIRKELKIKEGTENLRKVTTDKKSLTYVDDMLKKSNKKVEELHQELQELNAHIVVKDPEDLLGNTTLFSCSEAHKLFHCGFLLYLAACFCGRKNIGRFRQ